MSFKSKLEPATQKVERAHHHIDDLSREIEKFLESRPFRLVQQHSPATGRSLIEVKQDKSIPISFSLILGDAVHNIRAALDMVMFSLLKDVAPDPTKIAFPIAMRSAAGLPGAITRTQAHLCAPPVIDVIHALEPYPGGRYQLQELHALDLLDKHRLILTTTYQTRVNSLKFGRRFGGIQGRENVDLLLDAGVRFDHGPDVRLNGAERRAAKSRGAIEQEINIDQTYIISFYEGQPLARQPVIETLKHLAENTMKACEQLCGAQPL